MKSGKRKQEVFPGKNHDICLLLAGAFRLGIGPPELPAFGKAPPRRYSKRRVQHSNIGLQQRVRDLGDSDLRVVLEGDGTG